MAAESVEALLRSLYVSTNMGDAAQVYAAANGLTLSGGEGLEQVVRRKLTANAKTAQLRESLLATITAGGAVGETVEQCLLKTGLLGFS